MSAGGNTRNWNSRARITSLGITISEKRISVKVFKPAIKFAIPSCLIRHWIFHTCFDSVTRWTFLQKWEPVSFFDSALPKKSHKPINFLPFFLKCSAFLQIMLLEHFKRQFMTQGWLENIRDVFFRPSSLDAVSCKRPEMELQHGCCWNSTTRKH